jgi:NAD-reducing hydrogenase large subunit
MWPRNIVGVVAEHPDIAKKGVLLRKYGQEVIRMTAGKRVHGTGSIPGGVNKSLSKPRSALPAQGRLPDGGLEPGRGA